MSQIFDSLRRGRRIAPRQPSRRTAQADAVLATLGYAPPRQSRRYGSAVAIAAIAAVVGVMGWLGWRTYFDDRNRSAPPRPAAPLTSANPASSSTPRAAATANSETVRDSKPEADPGTSAATLFMARQSSGSSHLASSSPHSASGSLPTEANPNASGGREDSQPRIPDPGSRPSTSSGRPEPVEGRIADPGTISPPSDLTIALYFHRAGEFENALRYYRLVLERDELNAQAHNNLGLLYQERRLLQDSARELKRALAIEPRNAGAHNNYGVTLLMLGRIDEAVAEFQAALAVEPGNLDALVNLGLAQRDLGQLDTAKETLLRALNLAPDNAAAHYNLAQLYDQTNEPARAVEHYRRFLEHAGVEHADRGAAVRARITALSRFPE